MNKEFNDTKTKLQESRGEIKPLKEASKEEIKPKLFYDEVIDKPEDFSFAISNAQMDGVESVEVSERMFKFLVKNHKTPFLTYGNPGIKVYLEGTREEQERIQQMNCEQLQEYLKEKKK